LKSLLGIASGVLVIFFLYNYATAGDELAAAITADAMVEKCKSSPHMKMLGTNEQMRKACECTMITMLNGIEESAGKRRFQLALNKTTFGTLFASSQEELHGDVRDLTTGSGPRCALKVAQGL